MANFVDCWGKVAKALKDADGSRILNEHDRQSILDRIGEHVKAGVSPHEAAQLSVQFHLDDTRNQIESIYNQAGVGRVAAATPSLRSQQTLDLFDDYAKNLPPAAKVSKPALKEQVKKDVPALSGDELALSDLFKLAQPRSEIPTLRRGEKQGDLLSKQTEDLKLVGEKGIDHEARQREAEKAEKEAQVSKAEQEKAQRKLLPEEKPSEKRELTTPIEGSRKDSSEGRAVLPRDATALTKEVQGNQVSQVASEPPAANKGVVNASTIAKSESVGVRSEGAGVGEEAPLRQSGQAAEIQKGAVRTEHPATTGQVYLVRHGTTKFNQEGGQSPDVIRGHIDVPLDTNGARQAVAAGKGLAGKGITKIYTSDLSRAANTAGHIAGQIGKPPVVPLYGLRPWKLGPDIEGKPTLDVRDKIEHFARNPDERPRGGESFNEFKNRFTSTLDRIKADNPNENIAVVTHYRGLKLLNSLDKSGNVDVGEFTKKDDTIPPGSFMATKPEGTTVEARPRKVTPTDIRSAITYKGKQPRDYKRSSTQVTLSPVEAKPFTDFAKSIPENEIYTDPEDPTFGREDEPHITALYGITDAAPVNSTKAILESASQPIQATVGKLSMFKNDKYDVLQAKIESPDLHRINDALQKSVPFESDFPKYTPHLTLAYLKKGEGKKYVGDTRFEGAPLAFNSVDFRSKDGRKFSISLTPETLGTQELSASPRKLFEDNLPLANRIASRFDNIPGVERGDIQARARTALLKAAQAYDPARGPFNRLASVSIANELKRFYNVQRAIPEETTLEAPVTASGLTAKDLVTAPSDVRADINRAEADRVLRDSISELPVRMQNALNGVLDGEMFTDIGKRMGVSKQGAQQLAVAAMRRLKGKLGERGIRGVDDLFSQAVTEAVDTPEDDPIAALMKDLNSDLLDKVLERTRSERLGEFTVGRPDLALGAEGPAVRAADILHTKTWNPETIEDWDKIANEHLSDPKWRESFKGEILKRYLSGDRLRNWETRAALRMIAEDSHNELVTSKQSEEYILRNFAYRRLRAEAGRNLAAGRDPFKSPEERNRQYLGETLGRIPPDLEQEIDGISDPVKRQAALEKAIREQRERVEAAWSYVAGKGVTLDDVFNGATELRLVGSKIIDQQMKGYSEAEQKALKLAQKGQRTPAQIANATGLTEKDVRDLNDAFISDLEKSLMPKTLAGATLENLDPLLLAQPTEPRGKPTISEEAARAEARKMIKAMGFVSSKDLGKMTVAKRKRSERLFVPPAPTGKTVEPPTSGELPYPAETTGVGGEAPAVRTGRVLGQPGLPLYPEMMTRKGADMSNVDDVVKLARVAQATNGNRFDMLFELGLAHLLSNPTTHISYKLALGIGSGWEHGIQRSVEAFVNLFVRDPMSADFREFKFLQKAIGPAFSRAWRLGTRQWSTESDMFHNEVMNSQIEAFDAPGQGLSSRGTAISEQPLTQFFGKIAEPADRRLSALGNFNPIRGRAIRMPFRVLGFVDGYWKGANWTLAVTPFGYRIANRDLAAVKKEIKGGSAPEKAVDDVIGTTLDKYARGLLAQAYRSGGDDGFREAMLRFQVNQPGSEASQMAVDLADWLGMRQKILTKEEQLKAQPDWAKRITQSQVPFEGILDNLVANIATARSRSHLFGMIQPFVQLPYNISKVFGGKLVAPIFTPIKAGIAAGRALPRFNFDPHEGFFNFKKGVPFWETYAKARFVKDVATGMITAGLMWAFWDWIAGDADDYEKSLLITGPEQHGAKAKGIRELRQRAYGGPFTISWKGNRFNYGKFEPGATVLGTLAATIVETKHALRSEESPRDALNAIWNYFVSQVEEKTYLQNLGNILKVIDGDLDPSDYAKRTALSWLVPGFVRAPLRALDDYERETRGASLTQLVFPWTAPKKIELYGRPLMKTGNAFTRMFTQTATRPMELQKADRLMMNWYRANPKYEPGPPVEPRTVYKPSAHAKEVKMTQEQAEKFLTAVGKKFDLLSSGQFSEHQITHPTEEDIKKIHELHTRATQEVKQQMFPKRQASNVVRNWLKAA